MCVCVYVYVCLSCVYVYSMCLCPVSMYVCMCVYVLTVYDSSSLIGCNIFSHFNLTTAQENTQKGIYRFECLEYVINTSLDKYIVYHIPVPLSLSRSS